MHFRGAESARDWLCVTIVLSIKEPASLGKQAIEQTAGCCVTRIVQWCLSLAVLIAKRSNVFQSWVGVGMRGTGGGVGGAWERGGVGNEMTSLSTLQHVRRAMKRNVRVITTIMMMMIMMMIIIITVS